MTTETKMCGVCNKAESARTCSECCIPLCDMCTKEVLLQDTSPGSMIKPGISTSPIRAGSTKKKVCLKCMEEVDFM